MIVMVALASTNYSPNPDKEKASVTWKLWFAQLFLLLISIALRGEGCYCWHIQCVFFPFMYSHYNHLSKRLVRSVLELKYRVWRVDFIDSQLYSISQ